MPFVLALLFSASLYRHHLWLAGFWIDERVVVVQADFPCNGHPGPSGSAEGNPRGVLRGHHNLIRSGPFRLCASDQPSGARETLSVTTSETNGFQDHSVRGCETIKARIKGSAVSSSVNKIKSVRKSASRARARECFTATAPQGALQLTCRLTRECDLYPAVPALSHFRGLLF